MGQNNLNLTVLSNKAGVSFFGEKDTTVLFRRKYAKSEH